MDLKRKEFKALAIYWPRFFLFSFYCLGILGWLLDSRERKSSIKERPVPIFYSSFCSYTSVSVGHFPQPFLHPFSDPSRRTWSLSLELLFDWVHKGFKSKIRIFNWNKDQRLAPPHLLGRQKRRSLPKLRYPQFYRHSSTPIEVRRKKLKRMKGQRKRKR